MPKIQTPPKLFHPLFITLPIYDPAVTLLNPSTPLFAATTCHGTVPCLVPLIPLNFASKPNARNWPSTSFNKFSAVDRVCTVGVHMRLLVLLSWTGLGPADELPPPPAADPAAP